MTTTSITTPRFLSNPRNIAWMIVLITIAWALLQWALSAIAFLAIVVVFLFGFKKPIWALAALLLQQLTVTSYMLATPFVNLSLRLLLILLTFFILRKALIQKEIDFGPQARNIVIPSLFLVVVTVVANFVNTLGISVTFTDFRNVASGLLFALLLPAIIENSKQLKLICAFIFTIATASALISIMQHYNMLGMGQATIIPDFMSKLGRASGMSEMELELSYILSVVIIVLLGIYLRKGLEVINRNWLFIPLIVLAGGLYYSYTRSSIFAVACGLVSILLFILLRSKWWIILAIVFVVFVFLENSNVVAGKGVSGRDSMEQLESSISREILWQAGLAIAEDHPILGIGVDQFIKVSPQYTARVDPALIQWETNRYWSYRTLGNEPPHNDYMMMWVSYGIIALVLFIWLHFVIFNNFMKAYFLSTDKFTKGISLGFAAALVTYVVNSFYHNMLATMPLFWVLAGFSLVTMKLAKKEKKLQPVPELMTEISTKQA